MPSGCGIAAREASCHSCDQSGESCHTATAKTMSARPPRPKVFSRAENFTRQKTNQSAAATTGIHR